MKLLNRIKTLRNPLKPLLVLCGVMRSFIFCLKNDPVKGCDVYKKEGCAHVDGFLCDYPGCSILKNYRNEQNKQK